jgi:peroxiredoxin
MAVESFMVEPGTPAPDFDLPNANAEVEAARVSLSDVAHARVLVVVFTCNHCPYVKHIEPALVRLARSYSEAEVAFVAISSNDPSQYPDDNFEAMRDRAAERGFPFPYLFDESQDVARAYRAACTPDFFVYDADQRLAYRGRFDETRPGGAEAHGGDLRGAIDGLLSGEGVTGEQWPAIGCSIKWKA